MADEAAPCLARSGRVSSRSSERTRTRAEAKTLLLLCLVLASLAAASAARKPRPQLKLFRTKLIPRIYRLEDCTDKAHSFRLINITSAMGPLGLDMFDVDYEMLTSAKFISQIKMIVQRCTGVVSAHMCEKFNTWVWSTAICDLMAAKHMAWASVTQMVTPPLRCPMQAGVYVMRNASVDLDIVETALPGINMEKYIWLSEFNFSDENRNLYGCIKWVTEARRVRIKDDGILG